jgi:NAD(P)-dependent dehydrogenase (short-subunit alcohol dehydrogenase family)
MNDYSKQGFALEGRGAIVTGAGGGIGEAIAEALVGAGAATLLVDLDGDLLQQTTSRLANAYETNVSSMVADVSKPDQVSAFIEHAAAELGCIDILCNNAAVTVPKPVDVLAEEEWDRVIDVGLKGIYLAVRDVVPHLRSRGGGVIINIASVDAFVAERGIPAYSAMKGGVLNLTRALALDYARDGIRVNCVCPGMTDTPLFRYFMGQAPDPEESLVRRLARVPMERLVQPAEVANAALFLASPLASAITGSAVTVDCGLTAGWDYSGD